MTIGTVVFSGNKADGKLNDIHNTGTLNFIGNVTLDGGISGNGTVIFANNTTLTVKTDTTIISNNIINQGAKLSLVFENGYEGGNYTLVSEEGSLDKEFKITENSLYDIIPITNGTYQISKKELTKVIDITDANHNQMNTINAIISGSSDSENFNNIANHISALLQSSQQSEVQTGMNAVTALASETAPVSLQTQSQTVSQVFGVVSTRLSGSSISTADGGAIGMSSGDQHSPFISIWVQGLWNKSNYNGGSYNKGYDADTTGMALGIEKYIDKGLKIGIGYAYTKTDIDSFMRSTDVDTHTTILYGEYKPSNWFVNTMISYGWSDYSEYKNVAGLAVLADYDATTLGLQSMTGYELLVNDFSLTPEIGLRYLHINQNGYKDTADQYISENKSDILTAIIGTNISKNITLKDEIILRPELRLAATYDIFYDDGGSSVYLANGSSYTIKGEALNRFAYELGLGLTTEFNNKIEMSLKYEGQFRKDYENHTGLLNIKYKF